MSVIQSGDLFLIERAGVSYKMLSENFTDDIQETDLFLVNRGGLSYQATRSDLDNAPDSDLLLVNRGSRSYSTTLGSIRGVIARTITFTVELASTAKSETGSKVGNPGNCAIRTVTANGGKLIAEITALEDSSFSFDGFGPISFNINGDWMMIVGNPSTIGKEDFISQGSYGICNIPIPGQSAFGLAALGQKTPGPQQNDIPRVLPPFYDLINGGGGAGCPAGATSSIQFSNPGGTAGYSQTRPRGEDTGSNQWNDIIVDNPVWTPNTSLGGDIRKITFNGITKSFSSSDAGVLQDFRSWT
jgi:hypothetical protein